MGGRGEINRIRARQFSLFELAQMRNERMEDKIKTPQTQGFLFIISRRLGVENCFSIHSNQFCSKKLFENYFSARAGTRKRRKKQNYYIFFVFIFVLFVCFVGKIMSFQTASKLSAFNAGFGKLDFI
jgi:hypothetical protein